MRIKPTTATQQVLLATYILFFVISCLAYTDFAAQRVSTLKLLMIKGVGVLLAFASIIESIKLYSCEWKALIIDDVSICWGNKTLCYHVNWNELRAITISGKGKVITQCEFTLIKDTPLTLMRRPLLSSANYELEANAIFDLFSNKSKEFGFEIIEF